MAKLKYEVLSPIRMADGELVSGGVIDLEEKDEDTRTFLGRDVIRLVPGQHESSDGGSQSAQNQNPNDDPETPASEKTLAELLGEDVASTLEASGYSNVEQVRAATDEDLDAVEGVGKKTIEKIRVALGEGGASGGAR